MKPSSFSQRRRIYGTGGYTAAAAAALALCAAGVASGPAPALALEIQGVQDAALSQPQVNLALVRPGETQPLSATGVDPITGDPTDTFTIQAYYDTGASGVLISKETADALGLARDPGIEYDDVGVGGPQPFDVSEKVNVRLAPYGATGVDLDNPNNFPGPYDQQFGPIRTQIAQTNAASSFEILDVAGIPMFQGKTAVFDARPVNQGAGDVITHVYASGSVPSTVPQMGLHVRMSSADLSGFTNAASLGDDAPTLAANPFIGENPLDSWAGNTGGQSGGGDVPPGVTVTMGASSSTGSWLFDTGAVTSMISEHQAGTLGVHYSTDAGKGLGGSDPTLLDANGNPLADQFILAVGGVGGQIKAAGFWLDSLTLKTE